MDKNFDSLAVRLEKKIYGTDKGYIRFELLKEDILDFCPGFTTAQWRILDAGGGTGRFSRFCASFGHEVVHCDISAEMLHMAYEKNREQNLEKKIQLVQTDLNHIREETYGLFDLLLLHGVAEWMEKPKEAVRNSSRLVKPGGYASYLIYNKNKYLSPFLMEKDRL